MRFIIGPVAFALAIVGIFVAFWVIDRGIGTLPGAGQRIAGVLLLAVIVTAFAYQGETWRERGWMVFAFAFAITGAIGGAIWWEALTFWA